MPLRMLTIDEQHEINQALTRLKIAPTKVAPSQDDYYRVGFIKKGQGCIARRPIARGTRILEEAPLFSFWISKNASDSCNLESLTQALGKLTLNDLDSFNALGPLGANNLERFAKNAYSMAAGVNPEQMLSGVFKQASRFNHSCLPNAFLTWNEHLGADSRGGLTIHAIRDIAIGEEILINYRVEDSQNSRTDRRRKLHDDYGFMCSCPGCDTDAPTAAQSEDNREWIRDIFETRASDIEKQARTPCRTQTRTQRYSEFHMLKDLLRLLEIEGMIYPQQANAYQWVAEWCYEELMQQMTVIDYQECRELGLESARNKLDLDILCNGCSSSEVHKSLALIRKLA